MSGQTEEIRGHGRRGQAEEEHSHGVRKARYEVAADADPTEVQTMAMFGWTDPKMPAHTIAQANRERLGISRMEKFVTFDWSLLLED